MRHFDLSPLYRSTVGFDRMFSLLDQVSGAEGAVTYPPYNIERTGETAYRITLAVATGLTRVLGHPVLVYLGTISFPIFVVHGALGQLFYKKIIATKVWGAVMPPSFFPAYCAIVLVAAAALHHLFIENKTVQGITADISKRISAAL